MTQIGQPQIPMSQFPIWATPEILKNAVFEVQNQTQTAVELPFASAMAAVSTSCQDQILVKLQGGRLAPVSLDLMIIAASGERKTTTDTLLFQSVRDIQDSCHASQEAASLAFQNTMEIWELERDILMKRFQKARTKSESVEPERLALESHNAVKPVLPKTPKMIYTDTTPQAMAWGLHTNWPSAALISDEGGMIFGGNAGRNLVLLNKLWDGGSVTVDRRTSESFILSGANLTLSVMIQPKTFQKWLETQGENARDSGFLARCLFAYPESTQGNRFINSIQDVVWKDLKVFNARLAQILEEGLNKPKKDKIILELSTEARVCWVNFYNFVESEMGVGRYWGDVRDAASKIAETSIRVAALFHHLMGRTGQIQVDTYSQAKEICQWYLFEFKRIFGVKLEVPMEQLDAAELERWVWHMVQNRGARNYIQRNYVRQHCPNSLRSKNRLDRAIDELVGQGKVWIGVMNKKAYVNLNPNYFIVQAQPLTSFNLPRLF